MGTMHRMRPLSEHHKIPGRSLPEIVGRYDGLISRQQNNMGRKFFVGSPRKERKIPAEVITNAIVLHFLDLAEDAQDDVLSRYLPELAGLMAEPSEAALPMLPEAGRDGPKGLKNPTRITGGGRGSNGENRHSG